MPQLITVQLCVYKHRLCYRPMSVCLSVHPSVTFVYCTQTAKDIVKHLSRPVSPVILVCYDPCAGTQFPRGTHSVVA